MNLVTASDFVMSTGREELVMFCLGVQVFCLFLGSFIYLQQIKETGGIHIQSSFSPKRGSAIAAYDGGS